MSRPSYIKIDTDLLFHSKISEFLSCTYGLQFTQKIIKKSIIALFFWGGGGLQFMLGFREK